MVVYFLLQMEQKNVVLGKVDVSGRINQWDMHTFLGYATEGKKYIVYIDLKTKLELRRKFGSLTDFVEKFHCIIIYYCIRYNLDNFNSLQICSDCGSAKTMKYLTDYFRDDVKFSRIKSYVRAVGKTARIHKLLSKARDNKEYDLKITKGMISKHIK